MASRTIAAVQLARSLKKIASSVRPAWLLPAAAIWPARHAIIYPSLMSLVGRRWNDAPGAET